MTKSKSKKNSKNSFAFPLGVAASILAVIGLAAVIVFAVNTIKDLTNKTADKAEYEKMLTPVVMFDPDPFDDINGADVSQLLNSAVWALLMSEEGADKYPYSEGENFGIIVPQKDIEQYFISLFGTEIDISSMHSSIDMSEYDITYDAAQQSYILPITGVESAYTPKVYDIEKQGSSLVLSVGYIGNKAWVQIADGEYSAPEPDKYMKITLRERSGGMYISSIQATDGQEVIGSSFSSTQTSAYIEETVLSSSAAETLAQTDSDTANETDESGDTAISSSAAEDSSEEENDN